MQCTLRAPTFFGVYQGFFKRTLLCTYFPHHLLLFLFSICFDWEIISKTKIEKSLRLPGIKYKVPIASLKHDFYIIPHAAPNNTVVIVLQTLTGFTKSW